MNSLAEERSKEMTTKTHDFDFNDWYEEWQLEHAKDRPAPTLYEAMLEAFQKGRNVGLVDGIKHWVDSLASAWIDEE